MAACNGLFVYHILGLASLLAVFYFSLLGEVDLRFPGLLPSSGASQSQPRDASLPFVERRGAQLVLEGRPFYINGWNSYWLMDQAVEPASRHRVSDMFRAAAGMGLTVCRTWAFNDGAYNALQLSPGRFDERVFRALDRVVVEARQHGVRLVLSLANNLEAYGGKTQYVRWAWDEGVGLTSSNDSFFFDPAIRDYFKVYLKVKLVAASCPEHQSIVDEDEPLDGGAVHGRPYHLGMGADERTQMHHRSVREHSAALDRGDGWVREIDRQEASADGGHGGVLRPDEPAGEAQRQPGALVQQLRPGLHPQLQDLRHRLRLRPSLPRQLAAARESGGEAQVRDPVGELPLRGRRHGAGQARGADGVRAVEHGEGLRPVAARRLLQVGVRHRARVGQAGRRRRRRHGVAARRRGHGGVPRRLRHRAQRHAVDAGDAQGAVVPAGHAQARGAGGQKNPEDGVRLRLIDLVFFLRARVLRPLGKSTRNGAERSTKGGVLACSVPTSADLAA